MIVREAGDHAVEEPCGPRHSHGRFEEFLLGPKERGENAFTGSSRFITNKGSFDCRSASHSRNTPFAQDDAWLDSVDYGAPGPMTPTDFLQRGQSASAFCYPKAAAGFKGTSRRNRVQWRHSSFNGGKRASAIRFQGRNGIQESASVWVRGSTEDIVF